MVDTQILAEIVEGGLHAQGRSLTVQDGAQSLSSGTTAAYIVVSIFLVIFSGICAGLTLGLLSLDK